MDESRLTFLLGLRLQSLTKERHLEGLFLALKQRYEDLLRVLQYIYHYAFCFIVQFDNMSSVLYEFLFIKYARFSKQNCPPNVIPLAIIDTDDRNMDDPVLGLLPPRPYPLAPHHIPHIGSLYSPFTANESRDLRKYENRGRPKRRGGGYIVSKGATEGSRGVQVGVHKFHINV
jgi:hypothetical protein